jgi:hypothetical protein
LFMDLNRNAQAEAEAKHEDGWIEGNRRNRTGA